MVTRACPFRTFDDMYHNSATEQSVKFEGLNSNLKDRIYADLLSMAKSSGEYREIFKRSSTCAHDSIGLLGKGNLEKVPPQSTDDFHSQLSLSKYISGIPEVILRDILPPPVFKQGDHWSVFDTDAAKWGRKKRVNCVFSKVDTTTFLCKCLEPFSSKMNIKV